MLPLIQPSGGVHAGIFGALPYDGNERSREIVGIFVARTVGHLADMVDECCNIDECEFASIGSGGIMWDGDGPKVPVDPSTQNDSEDAPGDLNGATFAEGWAMPFYGYKKDLIFESSKR